MATIIATARQIEGNIEDIQFSNPQEKAAYETAIAEYRAKREANEAKWLKEADRIDAENGNGSGDAYYNSRYDAMEKNRPRLKVIDDANYGMVDMSNPHMAGRVTVEITF